MKTAGLFSRCGSGLQGGSSRKVCNSTEADWKKKKSHNIVKLHKGFLGGVFFFLMVCVATQTVLTSSDADRDVYTVGAVCVYV